MNLRVERWRSIAEIPEGEWDGLNAPYGLFHTHRFIRAVEEGSGGVDFWYLLLHEGGRLVGSAPLSLIGVRLDLFMGRTAQRFVASIRRIWPSFLLPRILFCGLPISIGKHAIAFAEDVDHHRLLERLVEEMEAIARDAGVGFLCVKEFEQEGDLPVVTALPRTGFLYVPSLPYARLPLRWGSFDSYLGGMRHGYRRVVLKSLRKLRNARVVVGGEEVCSSDRFFALYANVMERATTKLEILTQEFFRSLYNRCGKDLRVIAVLDGNEVLGAALCTVDGRRMTFMLVGLDYAVRDAHDVYFNLIYGIVRNAVETGCLVLDLGQTSNWLKSRIGAGFASESFYLRAENGAIHRVLALLRPVFFPEIRPPAIRVFRDAGAGSGSLT
jgi:predicted N-acyltransferase